MVPPIYRPAPTPRTPSALPAWGTSTAARQPDPGRRCRSVRGHRGRSPWSGLRQRPRGRGHPRVRCAGPATTWPSPTTRTAAPSVCPAGRRAAGAWTGRPPRLDDIDSVRAACPAGAHPADPVRRRRPTRCSTSTTCAAGRPGRRVTTRCSR